MTSSAAPTLKERLKRGIADGVLDYNGREETLGVWRTKAFWNDLLAFLEASAPPAAERTALKELRKWAEDNIVIEEAPKKASNAQVVYNYAMREVIRKIDSFDAASASEGTKSE